MEGELDRGMAVDLDTCPAEILRLLVDSSRLELTRTSQSTLRKSPVIV